MKLYTFSHNMLSKEQQMIQAQHAQAQLFNRYVFKRYPGDEEQHKSLKLWSTEYSTHVALNGGNSPELHDFNTFIAENRQNGNHNFPFAAFWEDECINEMMTAIAIILPEKIYHTAWMLRMKMIERSPNGFTIDPQNKLEQEEIADIRGLFEEWTFNSFDFELI